MRNPILQIRFNNLIKSIDETHRSVPNFNDNMFYNTLFKNVQKYSERHVLIVTNKIFDKVTTFSDNESLFNRILVEERTNLNHRTIKLINKGDIYYNLLIDITSNAEEFCNVFNLELFEGFRHYVKIGLELIGRNYGFNKFKTYNQKIFDTYDRYSLVEQDENKELTYNIFRYYTSVLGIIDADLNKLFKLYGHDFVYTRIDIEDNNAEYKQWIDAQISYFKSMRLVPMSYQLHGYEALKRYLSTARIEQKDNWRERAIELKKNLKNNL